MDREKFPVVHDLLYQSSMNRAGSERMARTCIGSRTLLTLTIWLLPAAASGTTFVLMDQAQLIEASDAVVVGTVSTIESAASEAGGPLYTYVHIEPDLVLKGDLDAGPIILQEPGGSAAGRAEWVFGAPEFWTGERSLLFLTQNADGSLQTTNLAMGKYTVSVDASGELTAVRNFGYGAAVYVPETGKLLEAQSETQSFGPFVEGLRNQVHAQAALRPRPVRRLHTGAPKLAAAAIVEQQEAFTLLGSPPARWFEPDSDQPVRFLVDGTGDATLGPEASRAAVDAAMAAWTNVPTANLVLEDAGTAAPAPWKGCGASELSFNDPGHEMSNPHDCGGILAIGGFCTGSQTTVVNGRTFLQITSGKVVFNDGWGACSFWNQCNLGEVATHELGHAIGFGHSSDKSATMSAYAHFDGRCAGLSSDDKAAVSYVYPAVGGPSPGATPTSPPSGNPTPTAPPGSTPVPTTAPATPVPTSGPPPVAAQCSGSHKVQVAWFAKNPSVAKVTISATKCPPPPRCDTPFSGGLATAAPATMTLSGANAGGFARVIDQDGYNHGGCPGGSDTYEMGSDRLRLVFGAAGRTTVVAKVSVPVAGMPTLSSPLTFSFRDATGYAIDVSAVTCTTKQTTTSITFKCF